ncbi:MAG TPA: urease accessory protein UreE [Vicinamibacterales bacterium]|nr:urease accessory protein UreE [Vicinamibacterales bacterium]
MVETVFRLERLPAGLIEDPRDGIELTWADRLKTRARRRTIGGVEFGLALPRGTVLRDGDCLALDHPRLVVVVQEALEPVVAVRPESAGQWALWAYYIGNSHLPLMIAGDALVCADDPGVEQVLAYHLIPFTRERRPFTPVSAAPGHHV